MPVNKATGNIGKLLLESGQINAQQAEQIIALQQERGIRFGEAALQLGFVDENDIQRVLSKQFDYDFLPKNTGGLSDKLIAAFEPANPRVEALRGLRSQIVLRTLAEGQKMVLIASHDEHPGRSLTAANLAVMFSQMGERTLLVDANLRHPVQHQLFGLENRIGLSDLLAGRADLSAIREVNALRDLSVLTAGNPAPNPQELLSRPAFLHWIKEWQTHYDVVLFDVPAAVVGADFQLVASRVRSAVLVACQHQSTLKGMAELRDQLAMVGSDVLGVVLSD